ncbi:MAG: glucuronate isomerase [Clostridiales bacterium]|nr:glucuronate isomerase [Clostridiales bacterium]
MKKFITESFLLQSEKAMYLYNEFARDLPIIDYHCHLSPSQIADDIRFDNIADIWLSGDHYKWRLMRSAGIPEDLITGQASSKDKFMAWAKTVGIAWGNPLYHWTSLELARYFDIFEPLNEYNAEEVWEKTSARLSENNMTATFFLKRSNVELLCTTDDPTDDLSSHKKIAESGNTSTRVLPTFRPDPAVEIMSGSFRSYIARLSKVSNIGIVTFEDLKNAVRSRLDHFAEHGSVLSDHGLERIPFSQATPKKVASIFARRMQGDDITEAEADIYKTAMLLFLAREYASRGWTMQMHFGCRRDNNTAMFDTLGKDIGCDTIAGSNDIVTPLARFMSELDKEDSLPKMILYSLDPAYNAQIDTLIGCFQKGPDVMKIQHGSAWWFNDNIEGMTEQMRHLALQSYFPGFIGMLTDSRSFLSYPRHEYFRRILCNMIADSINKGEFPDDDRITEKLIRNICHDNAARYFGVM